MGRPRLEAAGELCAAPAAGLGHSLLLARSGRAVRREPAIAPRPAAPGIVPIPPNVILPERLTETALSRLIASERHRGRLVLGHFGSIYPRKQSSQILDLTAALVQRGANPFAVFLGSFVKGQDDVEGDFRARAKALGVEDRIHVSGYIADDADLFAAFAEVDVFAYLFAEGLTSRRGSVLACAMAGRPVVVNAPKRPAPSTITRPIAACSRTGGCGSCRPMPASTRWPRPSRPPPWRRACRAASMSTAPGAMRSPRSTP